MKRRVLLENLSPKPSQHNHDGLESPLLLVLLVQCQWSCWRASDATESRLQRMVFLYERWTWRASRNSSWAWTHPNKSTKHHPELKLKHESQTFIRLVTITRPGPGTRSASGTSPGPSPPTFYAESENVHVPDRASAQCSLTCSTEVHIHGCLDHTQVSLVRCTPLLLNPERKTDTIVRVTLRVYWEANRVTSEMQLENDQDTFRNSSVPLSVFITHNKWLEFCQTAVAVINLKIWEHNDTRETRLSLTSSCLHFPSDTPWLWDSSRACRWTG